MRHDVSWRSLIPAVPLVLKHPWVPGAKVKVDARRHTTYWRRGLASYEPHVAQLLQNVISPTWLCVEVGSHVGFFTIVLASLSRRVLVFEPDPGNLRATLSNLRRSGLMNVVAVPAACGARTGVESFVRDVDTGAAGGLAALHHGAHAGPSTAVVVVRLDEHMASVGVPDFVKIDAEGAELAVLEGMGSLLDGPTRILVELSESTKVPVHDLLRRRGYRLRNPHVGMVDQPAGTFAGWHVYADRA